jgi:hypothetical protein
MNGVKASLTTTDNIDRHTFLAPKNVVLPKAVGRFLSIEIILK